jgi:hypothetical protein
MRDNWLSAARLLPLCVGLLIVICSDCLALTAADLTDYRKYLKAAETYPSGGLHLEE